MAKHTEHKTRDGSRLLVGHMDNTTVAHEIDETTTPPRIARETRSAPGNAVRDENL